MENTNTMAANATQEQKKEAYMIKVAEHADFDAIVEIKITTTKELSVAINEMMKTAYDDYIGCTLVPYFDQATGSMRIAPKLYFKVYENDFYTNKDNVFAFTPEVVKSGSFVDRLSKMTNPDRTSGIIVDITEDGKSGLEEFFPRRNGKKVNWKDANLFSVKITNETIVTLNGAAIEPLVRKIYGGYCEEGGRIDYAVQPIKPVTAGYAVMGMPQNYEVQITRIKDKVTARTADQLGMMWTGSNSMVTPMVRADK